MGFLVGIANAASVSFQNTGLRKLAGVENSVLNALRFFFAACALAVLISFVGRWQFPPRQFWPLFFVSLAIEIFLSFCYVKAFHYSPQSLVGPLFSFTVAFLVPTGFLILGELPSPLGILGIFLMLIGALILGWDIARPGMRNALKMIFREKGSMFMLGAALSAAIVVPVEKSLFQYVSPLMVGFWISIGIATVYLPPALFAEWDILKKEWKTAALVGFAQGVGNVLHYIGLSLLFAAYYISVKRLSVLFDVIAGRIFRHENHTRERLWGASFMLCGILLIAFG